MTNPIAWNTIGKRLKASALVDKPEDIVDIAPLAFTAWIDGDVDPESDAALTDACFFLTPIVNPIFDEVLTGLGARKNGSRSYALSLGEDASVQSLEATLQALPLCICRTRDRAEKLAKSGSSFPFSNDYSSITVTERAIQATSIGARVSLSGDHKNPYLNSDKADLRNQMIVLSSNGRELMIQACTVRTKDYRIEPLTLAGSPDLDLYRPQGVTDPKKVTADIALSALLLAEAQGQKVVWTASMIAIADRLKDTLIAQPMPGSPALARMVAGHEIAKKYEGMQVNSNADKTPANAVVEAATALELIEVSSKHGITTVLDASIQDVVNMSRAARDKIKMDGLRPFQNEAVALHLATEIGYVNASSVGLGKTIMALAGMRATAEKTKNYRGFVTCPVPLRSQWLSEAATFFPEAQVEILSNKEVKNLDAIMEKADEAGKPLVVIAGYPTMRTHEETFCKTVWHDVVCDEAAFLKNASGKQTKALWEIRSGSVCAVGLTATPIDKSVDDLGSILAWTRNDRAMFYGDKLSKRFEGLEQDEMVTKLWQALGPTVFRRDHSEIAGEIPRIDTQVIKLDPTPAELKLADAARREMRRLYEELMAKIDRKAELAPSSDAFKEMQEELKTARGRMLGSTTLARMAAVDPTAVAASTSPGADMLGNAGLVAPAVKNGGTKRAYAAEQTKAAVDNGEAVLVFTDFATVAEHLYEDMLDLDLRVGVFKGGANDFERAKLIRDYQGTPCAEHKGENMDYAKTGCADCIQPTLDVLVLTRAAREGLNLQRTNTVIMLDLPWVPSEIIQRIGRAARFGSKNAHIRVVIPVMTGTIEERVVSLLLPRAITALTALDTHRGVDAKDTEMGMALRGLSEAVSDEERVESGNSALLDIAAELLR